MLFEIYYDHNKSAETQGCLKLSYHITDRLLAAGKNATSGPLGPPMHTYLFKANIML